MPALESGGEPFVIASQATEAAEPAESAFDDPPSRQEREAPLRLGVFHNFQANSLCSFAAFAAYCPV